MFQSGVSTKRKFITEALFKTELNEILKRELSGEDGFSEIDIRTHPTFYEIFIHATKPKQVRGENGRRIRELTSVVSKRFNLPPGKLVLLASEVPERGLCAITQAESLRYKLLEGVMVRRACYGVIRFVMDSGARGVEVTVSGKLKNQRAKSMKFHDGLMIHSGHPVNDFVRTAVRHVQLRQGMLGIKVKIMLPDGYTVKGKIQKPLPDHITILQPKEEPTITAPYSVNKEEETTLPTLDPGQSTLAASTAPGEGQQYQSVPSNVDPSQYAPAQLVPQMYMPSQQAYAPRQNPPAPQQLASTPPDTFQQSSHLPQPQQFYQRPTGEYRPQQEEYQSQQREFRPQQFQQGPPQPPREPYSSETRQFQPQQFSPSSSQPEQPPQDQFGSQQGQYPPRQY